MTDPTEHDPPLTAEQEASVRRALADAGGPEPLPDEVADRLDRVIAGLAEERAASAGVDDAPVGHLQHSEGAGVVVPMDAAALRRRTRVRVLLGAAAAVIAVGVGAGVLSDISGGETDAGTADLLAEGNPARSEEAGPAAEGDDDVRDQAEAPSAAGSDSPNLSARVSERVLTAEPLRAVRPDRLLEDLVAVQQASLPHPATADYTRTTLTAPKGFICEDAAYGSGYLVGVAYEDKPALVAFRQPMGSSQEAEVLACGTGDVLHSTTIPAGE